MSNKLPTFDFDLTLMINPVAFVNGQAYLNGQKYLQDNEVSTDDILLLSRYTYQYCEETLLRDEIYDEVLRYPQYAYYSNRKYEDDDYGPIINIIKSLGLKFNQVDLGIKEEENPIPQERKDELIGKFPSNNSLMTVIDFSELRRQYLAPYRHNIHIIDKNSDIEFDGYEEPNTDKYHNSKYPNVFISYKHDGWNITAYYIPEQDTVAYAHTRGRDGAKTRDCTFLMQKILPKLKVKEDTKIVFELVLKRDSLEYLRSKYIDKAWVNIRNSVSTFIAGHVSEEDYKCLDYKCFNISNSEFDNKDLFEKYKYLHEHGFNLPFFMYTSLNNIENLITHMDKYYNEVYSKDWECDGLVIGIDFFKWGEKDGKPAYKYNGTGLCAYKGGTWGYEFLETTIEEIYFGRSRKYLTPKARLKPIASRSGSMIQNVSLNNINLLQKYWLMPGDVIRVKYHSQQLVLFEDKVSGMTKEEYFKKYGEELKQIKSRGEKENA